MIESSHGHILQSRIKKNSMAWAFKMQSRWFNCVSSVPISNRTSIEVSAAPLKSHAPIGWGPFKTRDRRPPKGSRIRMSAPLAAGRVPATVAVCAPRGFNDTHRIRCPRERPTLGLHPRQRIPFSCSSALERTLRRVRSSTSRTTIMSGRFNGSNGSVAVWTASTTRGP